MSQSEELQEQIDELQRELSEAREERSSLLAELQSLRALGHVDGRPLPELQESTLVGYHALETEERKFTAHALINHQEFVLAWHALLSAFHRAVVVKRLHNRGASTTLDHLLRLQFIAASVGTAKLVLDATLAGYYAQAFALVRHMLETWMRLEYLRLNPESATRWYVQDDGAPPCPPNEGTVHRFLRSNAGNNRELYERVIKMIESLNVMAHPSQHTLQQTVGVHPTKINVGANYDPDLCAKALHEGGHALHRILEHFSLLSDLPGDWVQRIDEIGVSLRLAAAREIARRDLRGDRSEDYQVGSGLPGASEGQ